VKTPTRNESPARLTPPGTFLSRRPRIDLLGAGANLLLLALLLWLYRPVYSYLQIIFTRQEFRTNQIVLIAVLALLALQLRGKKLRIQLGAPPHLYLPALAMIFSASAAFLLIERFLDINTLSASFFGLAGYGFLGLWISPRRWRQGLPAALLLIGALPFGEHMQTFIGYPVRLATASIVRDGFAALGFPSIGVDTILVFENGISQVDLPCSGVKSLWAGGLFILAATWIDRRQINLRWLGAALAFAILLLAVNLARVGMLVGVGEVAGWRLAAEMLHVPLGVLGFATACGAAVILLRWTGKPGLPSKESHPSPEAKPGGMSPDEAGTPSEMSGSLPHPAWLVPLLGGVLLALSLLYTPRPAAAGSEPVTNWNLPAGLQAESWPLTQAEFDWLSSTGALAGDRWRFSWGDVQGTMLFVTGNSWRAQHRPERCFEVYGLSVVNSRTYLAAPDFPLQYLTLGDGEGREMYSAAYWFQSPDRVTSDYGARIWSDLAPEREAWVLVTVLFDDIYGPDEPAPAGLYPILRQAVALSLGEGKQP
jgi:exosortase O